MQPSAVHVLETSQQVFKDTLFAKEVCVQTLAIMPDCVNNMI